MICADYSAPPPVTVTICEPHKPAGAREYWSWREINGRPCWYAGRPGKPKTELRWEVLYSRPPEGRGAEPVVSPPQDADRPAPEPSITILRVTPVGAAEGSFDDRWLPVLSCGYHFVGTWDCRRRVQP